MQKWNTDFPANWAAKQVGVAKKPPSRASSGAQVMMHGVGLSLHTLQLSIVKIRPVVHAACSEGKKKAHLQTVFLLSRTPISQRHQTIMRANNCEEEDNNKGREKDGQRGGFKLVLSSF